LAISIIEQGTGTVIFEPRGDYDGLEGFMLNDTVHYEKCSRDNDKEYYRVWCERWKREDYSTCGIKAFNLCFKKSA